MSEANEDPHALIENGQDVILIDGLVIPAQIGVLESEKGRTQAVRFDVEILTVSGYRNVVRETGAFVSYADTVIFIQKKAASGEHIELVEEWAEAIAEFVLENPLAEQATVKVTKPEIFEDAAGVGICISRKRS
jgi:7,8-dihydroneopterin aldolase/epimerase/oxygenase